MATRKEKYQLTLKALEDFYKVGLDGEKGFSNDPKLLKKKMALLRQSALDYLIFMELGETEIDNLSEEPILYEIERLLAKYSVQLLPQV